MRHHRVVRGLVALVLGCGVITATLDQQTSVAATQEPSIPAAQDGSILLPSGQVQVVNSDSLGAFIQDAMAQVGSPDLVSALVVDDASGDVLYSQHDDRAMTPASTLKLVTSVGVLQELGLETRFHTRVMQEGTTLTIVGGGDPTLVSKTPDHWRGKPPGVEQPPSLDQLADLAAQKLVGTSGPFIVNFDSSYFSSASQEESWPKSFVKEGFVSPVTGLTVDFGVDDNNHAYKNPAKFAAEYFAASLTARGFVSSVGEKSVASSAAIEVASVNSAPVVDIVERMVTTSNNTMAEFLTHQVGKKNGDDSFAASASAVKKNVAAFGVDTSSLELHDGSGLSASNKVTPRLLIDVIRKAHNHDSKVWPLISGLPIAGVSGTLEERFAAQDSGRGFVRAKTGTLTGVVSLAGSLTTASGNVLDFAIMANGVASSTDTEKDVDALVKRLSECGCS